MRSHHLLVALTTVIQLLSGCGGGGGHASGSTDAGESADPCASCAADELCVALYDGTCNSGGTSCVPKTIDCPDNSCTAECQAAYCGTGPYQCMYRSPCGGEPPSAFTCYGP